MNQSICRQLCAWLLMLAGATYLAMQLTACNTVHGAGEDIESAGSHLRGEAAEHRHYEHDND